MQMRIQEEVRPLVEAGMLLIFPLWLAALSSGDADPSLSQLTGFMKRWRCDTIRFRGYAS